MTKKEQKVLLNRFKQALDFQKNANNSSFKSSAHEMAHVQIEQLLKQLATDFDFSDAYVRENGL